MPLKVFLGTLKSRNAEAKAICNSCPVQAECLTFALKNEDYEEVIYGGFTGAERKAMA
jgi:hypothetical protein